MKFIKENDLSEGTEFAGVYARRNASWESTGAQFLANSQKVNSL